ncbi:MAG TPA: polysaccharide biosynthesis C-terminal domain-containing protein [Pirellulales bacterium]|jgi:O-antigen/teichoic acid export membrane protein
MSAPESHIEGEAIDAALENLEASNAPPTGRIASLLTALAGGSMFRKGVLSLVDQGVVSAVNFLTMVLVGRSVGQHVAGSSAEHQVGLYQLGFSIIVLATTAQNALISSPYAVFGLQLSRRRRAEYAGSTLVHQWIFSAFVAVVLALVGVAAVFGLGPADLKSIAWILALVLPFVLLREFVRRISFAHLQVATVLLLDIAVAVLQLGGLLALKLTGHLTAVSAFQTLGLSCAIAGGAVRIAMRRSFLPRRANVLTHLKMNWTFGRWACGAQMVSMGMSYALSWMLAFLVDTEATGRYAVCMSLVMIANPLLIGLNNFLSPQSIHAFNAGGIAALNRLLARTAVWVTAAVSILCLLLIFAGGAMLQLIYGHNLSGYGGIVSLLALNMLMYGLSMSAENGLVAINWPAAIFWGNVVGLIVTLTAGVFFIGAYGLIGAAVASLIGTVTGTSLKGFFYLRKYRQIAAGSI